jgi:hypothetical protein
MNRPDALVVLVGRDWERKDNLHGCVNCHILAKDGYLLGTMMQVKQVVQYEKETLPELFDAEVPPHDDHWPMNCEHLLALA